MKTLIETTKKIFQEDKALLVLMIVTFILSAILFLYCVINLNTDGSVMKIGYNDVSGGYENGAWTRMLTFPILAVMYGVLHNLIAVRLFDKKGDGSAKVFCL